MIMVSYTSYAKNNYVYLKYDISTFLIILYNMTNI